VDNQIASLQRQLDSQNANAKAQFDGAVAHWVTQATFARDSIPPQAIPSKPVAPLLAVLKTQDTGDGVWEWQENGDPVGVCPDLPPPPAPTRSVTIAAQGVPDPVQILTKMVSSVLGDLQKIKGALKVT
jgi:hypothetical protein